MTKADAFLRYRDTMPDDERTAFERWISSAVGGFLLSAGVLSLGAFLAYAATTYSPGPGAAQATEIPLAAELRVVDTEVLSGEEVTRLIQAAAK
jgi:hypothetical protein